MLKRTLIVLSIVAALIVVVAPLQRAHGILISKAEWVKINSVDTPAADNSEKQKPPGNGFFRALGAPFKAIGRLFGHGKKDSNKLQRLSEKDAKKFESAPATRVNNATAVTKVSTAENSAGSQETTALEHLEKGRALFNSGNLNEAIAELSLAASLDPKLSEAHTLLGVAYDRKGLPDRAQQSFEVAAHAPDDKAMHLNNLGYLLYKHGDYEGAVKYLKQAAKVNPSDRRIWNNLGLAQLNADKFDDAYKSLAHATGEFEGRVKVAARLDSEGFTKKAVKQLEKARALKPDSTEVLSSLAVMYQEAGQYADADKMLASLYALQTVAAAPMQPVK